MADRTFRSGRDRYDRDRGYSRQAEQFDATDYSWRDDERDYDQMGEGWREEDYGQSETGRAPSRERGWGRDPTYTRQADYRTGPGGRAYGVSRYHAGENRGFGSFTGSDFGGRDFTGSRFTNQRRYPGGLGAGSRLAANHGEWRDEYGGTPSREFRDYRGTWGGETGERGWLERTGDEIASWFGDEDAERRRRMDYRGHGPSGYTRSDERIMEDANDALTEDWGVDARQISVSVTGGEVTLDGTVPSREQKRRAEDLVDDLSGVKNVQNNLRVQDRASWERSESEYGSQSNPTSTQA